MEVKFFPRNDVDVQICDIKDDKDAVIVQHTDTLQGNTAWYVEALGFKYGIKPTAFVWPYSGIGTGLKDMYDSGVLKFGVYHPTDKYVAEDGISRYLRDYSSSTYSQLGVDYYGTVELGQSKSPGFPNNGQELFDLTNGVKGYDVVNGVPGSENNMDFIRQCEVIRAWYFSELERYPSGAADRQGKIGSKEVYIPYYLGIRDTAYDQNTSYGQSKDGTFLGSPDEPADRVEYMQKYLTSRWELGFGGNQSAYSNIVVNGINNAFIDKGMFNDFVHWHRAISAGGDITLLEQLYSLIHTTVDGRNAWYTGFSEAMEYLWYRELAKRARGTFFNNRLHITIDFVDDFKNELSAGIPKKMLYELLKTPLTVKVDLSGTDLADKEIRSNYGKVIKVSPNVFLVDVPFGVEKETFKGVVIYETTSADYKNFSKPVISQSSTGSGIVVNTDIPTTAVLFQGDFQTSVDIIERSNSLKTEHTFSSLTGSYMIGVCSEEGISNLIEIQ